MKKYLLLLSCAFTFGSAKAQLTITDSLSLSQITTLLEGTGISVSGLTVVCDPRSIAEFSGTSELSITHGLALSTGFADDMAGANASSSTSGMPGTPGDPDLDAMSTFTTNDGCVLEFDCVPTGDTLLFNFSFGSEEYMEFAGSSFNDVFAILLSGPGLSGPYSGGAINAAALPGGTPVSINNVNAGVNPSYYYNNEVPAGVYVIFDGFTTNLTAFAEVFPGATYHFKVAIADASDYAFDSGVFLEAFSFRSVMGVTTGIAETNDHDLHLLPNPAAEQVQLQYELNTASPVSLMIYEMTGRCVMTDNIASAAAGMQTYEMNITTLSPGLYTLSLQTEKGISTRRLVVK